MSLTFLNVWSKTKQLHYLYHYYLIQICSSCLLIYKVEKKIEWQCMAECLTNLFINCTVPNLHLAIFSVCLTLFNTLNSDMCIFTESNLNPNCTGQDQSWPRQLWREIPEKFVCFGFLKNIPTPAMTFWCPFWCIFIRSLAAATPCRPPPLLLGFTAITDHLRGGRSPAGLWSEVWYRASQNSNEFPVPGCAEWGGCGGFSVRPALSFFLIG